MGLKKYFYDYSLLLGLAGSVVLFDQLTKYIVRTNLVLGQVWAPTLEIMQIARIVHWKNTGAANGILAGQSLILAILAVMVSLAILFYFPRIKRQDWSLRLAMGFYLGGAIGNLIDRLLQNGAVTDFISIGNFPILNLADVAVSTGVVVLLFGFWLKDRQQKQPVEQVEQISQM